MAADTRLDFHTQIKNKPYVDVKEFNAKGDGVTDDTAAITAALNTLTTAGGTIFFPKGTYIISSLISPPNSGVTWLGVGGGHSVIKLKSGTNLQTMIYIVGQTNCTFDSLGFNGNFINQTFLPTTLIACIDGTSSIHTRIINCSFTAFGYTNSNNSQYTGILALYSAQDVLIKDNFFYSNLGREIILNGTQGARIDNNTFGSPNLNLANTPTDWWDTYSGGFGIFIADASDISVVNNIMYGCQRADSLNDFGYLVNVNGSGGPSASNIQIQNNKFYGLGNARGTVTVTNGSGTILGTNTTWASIDVGREFQVEGDNTTYRITAIAGAGQLTVTPTIARASGSNLRFKYSYSGDVITCYNISFLNVSNNYVSNSGDNCIDISGSGSAITQHYICSNNLCVKASVAGIFLGGQLFDGIITGNLFLNNCRKQLSGHVGAIEMSPTNQGQTTAQNMWHNVFSNNVFIDDQVSATQLYAFTVETSQIAKIFGNTITPTNHVYVLAGGGDIFNADMTATMKATAFNHVSFGTSIQKINTIFAELGNLESGVSGGGPVDGTIVYCSDAKSVADGIVAGSTAVGGGTGAIIAKLNGAWKVLS